MKPVYWWMIVTAVVVLCLGIAGFFLTKKGGEFTTPVADILPKEKPLDAYTIDALSKRSYASNEIVFADPIATTSSFSVVPFHFMSMGKKVTGLAHLPMTLKSNKMPVVVQFRGFVPKEQFVSGVGTKRSAEVFASHGFISLAPDFLGYGGSDEPSKDVFEERFQTYATALTLLSSLQTIPFADTSHVFLWGHSNGGQIALTVLAVLGEKGVKYPTTLWAPVTKLFPYSILYYTDESDDNGKALRKALAVFEKDYDTDMYAFGNYLDRINAPLQLHQGLSDEPVPFKWSDDFVATLKKKAKHIQYFTYPNADHNLTPGWNTVVERDIEFFRSFL